MFGKACGSGLAVPYIRSRSGRERLHAPCARILAVDAPPAIGACEPIMFQPGGVGPTIFHSEGMISSYLQIIFHWVEGLMDRLEVMSIVLLTIEKGSLTAAAKALHMPLPTVSRKVTELEEYLGTKLLHRSTRKLTLTDSGQAYVESVKRIMEDIEEVERAAAGE